MSIPLATTTITVKGVRPQSEVDPDADGYDGPGPVPVVLATGVRASITKPDARRYLDGNDEQDSYALRCDNFDAGLTRHDTIIDELTEVEYEVRSVAPSVAALLGLEHIKATVFVREGLRNVSAIE